MRNAISGLILLACTCFVAFACMLVLTCVAVAADCGGCQVKTCDSCQPQTKCSPCKPDVERDPCRTIKPKCISTDGLKVPGLTKIPLPHDSCRKLPDCCEQGQFELLNLCPERYTLCPEGSDYTLLCDQDCKPCQPVTCNKFEYRRCNAGCKAPKSNDDCVCRKSAGGDDCSKCGKSPGCVKGKP